MGEPAAEKDPAVAIWHLRRRRRRRRLWLGVFLMAVGYTLIAVAPGVASEWVMVRVFLGLAVLVGGGILSVGPLIEWVLEG